MFDQSYQRTCTCQYSSCKFTSGTSPRCESQKLKDLGAADGEHAHGQMYSADACMEHQKLVSATNRRPHCTFSSNSEPKTSQHGSLLYFQMLDIRSSYLRTLDTPITWPERSRTFQSFSGGFTENLENQCQTMDTIARASADLIGHACTLAMWEANKAKYYLPP